MNGFNTYQVAPRVDRKLEDEYRRIRTHIAPFFLINDTSLLTLILYY